jgi:hypothetical protein
MCPALRSHRITLEEKALSAAQNDGEDHESVFVDEVMLHQCLNEVTAAVDEDVASRLLLQLGDLLRDVAADECGVVPLRLSERR